MSRRKARELAMHLVYQLPLKDAVGKEIIENYYEAHEIPSDDENEYEFDKMSFSQSDKDYINSTVMLVEENLKDIDSYIEKYSRGWRVSRIGKVELSIMRIAVCEMLKREDVPNASAINEAIELSKVYCEDKSRAFVNGVLGNIQKELENR